MVITEMECVDIVLAQVPGFRAEWQDWIEEDGPSTGLCSDVSMFSRYAIRLMWSDGIEAAKEILELAEKMMQEGDELVQTASATCFVEHIVNELDRGLPVTVIGLLGRESRFYADAWQKFCGLPPFPFDPVAKK
jgi:hypothetical protein